MSLNVHFLAIFLFTLTFLCVTAQIPRTSTESEPIYQYEYEYEDDEDHSDSTIDTVAKAVEEPQPEKILEIDNFLQAGRDEPTTRKLIGVPWVAEFEQNLEPEPVSNDQSGHDDLSTGIGSTYDKAAPVELQGEEVVVIKRSETESEADKNTALLNYPSEVTVSSTAVTPEESTTLTTTEKPEPVSPPQLSITETPTPVSPELNTTKITKVNSPNVTTTKKLEGKPGSRNESMDTASRSFIKSTKKPKKRRKGNTTAIPIQPETGLDETLYFISQGVEDTLEEERKGEATMLEKFENKMFYYGCQDDKECFGGPKKGCVALKSCDMAVAFRPKLEDGGVLFEILGKTPKFVAVGLSADDKMGDDNVIDCVRESGSVKIYRSRNKGRMNYRLADHSAISNLLGHYTNEWLYCSCILKTRSALRITEGNVTQTRIFDLDKHSYYLLLASGNSVDARDNRVGIGYHGLGSIASTQKYNLIHFGLSKLRRLFEKLHGSCFLVGWFFFMPISAFVMRYFKNTCHDKYVGNLSVWFAVHVVLNGVVVGLTFAGMLFVIISRHSFSIRDTRWNFHTIAGLVFCACVVTQVVMGIRVYAKRHTEEVSSSCFHAIFGHVTFLLSYAIIYKSKDVRHGLPCAAYPILITWIVLYFAIHLVLSYQVCYVDFILGLDVSRLYRFAGLAPSAVTDADPEPPGGVVRKAFLGILIVVSFLATGALLALYFTMFPDCLRFAEDQ